MNKPRQQFKGESLAHGPMDTMSGKLKGIQVRVKEKTKPAPVAWKTSHVVYGDAVLDADAVDTDDTKAAE